MARRQIDDKKALKLFRKNKVMTIEELAKLMECSVAAVRTRLKKWGVYTSYNMNAKYYALPEVPTFDQKGLWIYKQIRFCKHGNLRQSLIHLVRHCDAGLDWNQIEQFLGVSSNSFLARYADIAELRREKYQGRYVYFSADPQVYARQRDQRVKLIREAKMPSELEAVLILAEIIKHPDWDISRIAASLKRQKYPISPQMIQNLLDTHGLDAQKKGSIFP